MCSAVSTTRGRTAGTASRRQCCCARPPRSAACDFNISGEQIEGNTRRVLEDLVGWLDWTRVAMLPDQAAGLPEVTKTDNRYKPARKYKSVEVEALGQQAVLDIVRAALDELLPEPLDRVQVREQEGRDRVRELLEGGEDGS